MKRNGKIFAAVFVLGTFVLAGRLPAVLFDAVPVAEVILPVRVAQTPYISCTGVLEAAQVLEVYATQPMMIDRVTVAEGQWVQQDEMIATVDVATSTQLAGTNFGEANSTDQLEEYLAAARQYGLEEELAEYLEAQSQLTAGQSAVVPVADRLLAQGAGQLVSLGVQAGCLAPTGTRLYTLAGGSCRAVLQVEEADIGSVQVGSPVVLSGPGLGEGDYPAVVTAIAPAAHQMLEGLTAKTVVEVTAELSDEAAQLRPGLSVSAKIAAGPHSELLSIPYEAVAQDEAQREFVYQLVNGQPQKRYITVAHEQKKVVQVATGLAEGQPIVLCAEEFDANTHYKLVYRENWYD